MSSDTSRSPDAANRQESWAEERVRELARLFGIPDGARYINDAIEVAEIHKGWKRDLDAARAEIQRLSRYAEEVDFE